jgi:hypothetical protein
MEFLDKYQRFSGKALRVEADLTALRNEAEELEKMCMPRRRNGEKNVRRSKFAIMG